MDDIRTKIFDVFAVDIDARAFKGKAKFSDRMKAGFEAAGKLWSQDLEERIKVAVCEAIEVRPLEKLTEGASALFATCSASIESKLRAL